MGRVNTTSFTFESSVSSQGPLPKEDPVGGVCGGGVCGVGVVAVEGVRGVRKGGCTGLGGAEAFAH